MVSKRQQKQVRRQRKKGLAAPVRSLVTGARRTVRESYCTRSLPLCLVLVGWWLVAWGRKNRRTKIR
ncbi:hypothetical protein PIB30_091916, partial [Stylosanthes scabra]|nr:hypothetical protein [Stylosanthes scabra]